MVSLRRCASAAAVLLAVLTLRSQETGGPTARWDGDVLGNHRAVVRVAASADAVRVRIPWRRRDAAPEKKAVFVRAGKNGDRVDNVVPLAVTREFGDFVFQPSAGAGIYFIYYLPYRLAASRNYPQARYREPERTADEAWLKRLGLSNGAAPASTAALPEAEFVGLQAVDDFNEFSPMELIATAAETEALLKKNPGEPFLLFPEDRLFSIRMDGDLPQRWAEGPRKALVGKADRGEFYSFQIGVWACGRSLEDIEVKFSDLRGPSGKIIPASALRCINTGGTDWNGKPLRKSVEVPKSKIQAMWCGVQVPIDCTPGAYAGETTIMPKGAAPKGVRLELTITDALRADGGDGEPDRMSRLRWLDSTLAMDDEIVRPFTPLTVNDRTIGCLGRTVTLGGDGFPAAINSFFSSDVTRIVERGRDVLAGPMALVVEDGAGTILPWKPVRFAFTGRAPGKVVWEFHSEAGSLRLDGNAWMEMDGYVECQIRLSAAEVLAVKDVRLEIPWARDSARYMMGLGQKGGLRPSEFRWTWDQKKNQDSLWLGSVNAGMQVGLRAENYSRPLNTNFYLSKPLNLPPSWWNGGKGGVSLAEAGSGIVRFAATSGERMIEPGKELHFDFILLLTPFKTIDPKAQFATRFIHAYKPLDEIAASGANTINIHHANAINPYINYPFLRPAEMKAYIDEAHRRGFKVKIYNTIRELSEHAPEIYALRSLGPEIFSHGPGGGYSWLQEHLGGDYIPAWFVPDLKDAAVVNSGMSRWHNYYIEGLNWLARNIGIDGLYIDDVAFDRTTMKRVRKVLDRSRPGALIDLHSANQYNPRDGFVSSATLYLEHFPYLNRLWFGEYFDYQGSPADYWLVEVSGIPFGLMGEMLQDGGNPWRGMVYGMTNRLPWSGNDPSRLWKVWDAFGIGDARMIGYWAEDCPVRADDPEVAATVFQKQGKAMISLASWAKAPVKARLKIDWKALGLDPNTAKLRAPEIPDFQFAAEFDPGDPIPFEVGKGWILILE
jgi:hypothetical protein